MNEAKKNDDGKPRVDLVPFDAIEAAGEVLEFGTKKYAVWNWTQGEGFAWHRLIRAALSHLGKWAMGENLDPESGLSHLAHALCCLMFLVTYERRKHGVDDRPRLPWFAQNEGKDASSDTIPACGEPGVMRFDDGREELALGDEVSAKVGTVWMRGRVVALQLRASQDNTASVQITRDDGTTFELMYQHRELKKAKKQEAPRRDYSTEARTKTVRVPGQGGGYVVIEVCLTCGRKAGQCTATGGDLLCNSVIESFPPDDHEEND